MAFHEGRGAPGLLVAVALTVGFLAGCLGGDEPLDPPEPASSTDDPGVDIEISERRAAPSTIRAPQWRVGDYWVFAGSDGSRNTFVVTEDTGTDYVIDTDGHTFAFFNELDDISTLGPQRKSDLAGSQGSTRVEFFRFPLTDGDTWTTTWDGETRHIVATDLGGGVFGFASTAEDGTPHARYTYNAEARWFGALEFVADDGSTMFANALTESGRGFTGEVVRYEVEEVFGRDEGDAATPVGVDAATAQFTQDDSHTDVFLIYSARCAAGHLMFMVAPDEPSGETLGHSATNPCPKEEGFFGSLGSQPGDWGVTLLKATDPEAVWSAQVYLRTVTTLTVESGAPK